MNRRERGCRFLGVVQDLDRFVKHTLQDPYVERTSTQVVLNRVKEERRVPLSSRPT